MKIVCLKIKMTTLEASSYWMIPILSFTLNIYDGNIGTQGVAVCSFVLLFVTRQQVLSQCYCKNSMKFCNLQQKTEKKLWLYKCFQKSHFSFHFDFLGAGRKQDGFTGAQRHGLACVVDDGAAAFHTDEDDETVEGAVVNHHGFVEVINGCGEPGTSHQFHAFVFLLNVWEVVV